MRHACSEQAALKRKPLPGYGFQLLSLYSQHPSSQPKCLQEDLVPAAAVGQRSGADFRAIANLQAVGVAVQPLTKRCKRRSSCKSTGRLSARLFSSEVLCFVSAEIMASAPEKY